MKVPHLRLAEVFLAKTHEYDKWIIIWVIGWLIIDDYRTGMAKFVEDVIGKYLFDLLISCHGKR